MFAQPDQTDPFQCNSSKGNTDDTYVYKGTVLTENEVNLDLIDLM